MNTSKIRRTASALCATTMIVAAMPALAGAHTTVSPTEAAADSYAKLTFTVPHGCDEAATNKLIVQIPDGVSSVTPGVVPGWEIETTEGPLAEPIDNHGETITDGIREVAWTGGPLPDGYLQDFALSVKFDGGAGETRFFKAIQECDGGGEAAWIEEPAEGEDPHSLEMPAPAVTLIAAGDEGHDAAPAAAGDGEEEGDSDSDADTLSIVALIVGALGLGAGGMALLRTRN